MAIQEGIAYWASVTTPNTKYEPVYTVDLVVEDSVADDFIARGFKVKDIEKKPSKRSPSAPFTTSTLQQTSSSKLGFGASRTMQIAQRLYQGIEIDGETIGLITYMRTDGTNTVSYTHLTLPTNREV